MDVMVMFQKKKKRQRVVVAGVGVGTTGLVILFMVNIVRTTHFQVTVQNILVSISSFLFLVNGLFHHMSESKFVPQIFAVVESSYILVQSSPGCHYWSITLQ